MDSASRVSASKAISFHLICTLGLGAGFRIARDIYKSDLISNPSQTLGVLWVVVGVIVIPTYSFVRRGREQCSYWRAVGRGLIGLPVGALLNTFGAIVLGAPVRVEFLSKTINWSFLMSLFTFVPAASVFGSRWEDWQRLFAYTKPTGYLDLMICLPAHGAIIGAWFGAWPMPLDWDRPWQDWPISVSYGGVLGYLLGIMLSILYILRHGYTHKKSE